MPSHLDCLRQIPVPSIFSASSRSIASRAVIRLALTAGGAGTTVLGSRDVTGQPGTTSVGPSVGRRDGREGLAWSVGRWRRMSWREKALLIPTSNVLTRIMHVRGVVGVEDEEEGNWPNGFTILTCTITTTSLSPHIISPSLSSLP